MDIERNIFPIIEQSVDEYSVTLIAGARQVGKTTLALRFKEKGFTYLTFDDTELLAAAKKNPKKFIEEHPSPIIFDEIQKAKELFPEIENAVNKVKRERGTAGIQWDVYPDGKPKVPAHEQRPRIHVRKG